MKFKNGYAYKSDLYEDEGIPIIRIGDISSQIDLRNTKKVPHHIYDETRDFEVKFGDVLIALTGATIGKSSIFKENYPALLNQRVASIRHENNVYQEFVFFL
ncbi:MAG: restriction endonuclease subunit S [Saprospiraceae bacterium]|nr:restriction endonuclease subunit S [Saprospiraceae bacterium]